MKKTLLIFGLAVSMMPFFTSCELDEVTPQDLQDAGTTLNTNTDAELGIIKVFENVNNFGFGYEGLKSALVLGTQPSVTWSGNTMILDYSEVENASGKINVTFSGSPGYIPGLSADVEFEDYVNDGIGMDGEMVLKLEEFSLSQNALFSFKTNGNITVTEDNSSYLWACDQTFNWAEGLITLLDNSDDEFILDGVSTQTADTAVNKMTLTEVVYATSCEYIKDGEIELIKFLDTDDELMITCDFGIDSNGNDSGECDGYVKMTAGGLTLTIDLDSY